MINDIQLRDIKPPLQFIHVRGSKTIHIAGPCFQALGVFCHPFQIRGWITILHIKSYLSSPKPGQTTGGSGRRSARRTVGRGEAGQNKVPTFRKATVPLALQGTVNKLFRASLRKQEQRKSHVNRWGNKTSG